MLVMKFYLIVIIISLLVAALGVMIKEAKKDVGEWMTAAGLVVAYAATLILLLMMGGAFVVMISA